MSALSLFFLSLCRKFVSQWLGSANSQTSLLEDGSSASDYRYCSLTPSYYRLFWGLRAGSQAAENCGEALTPYIYPKNRMMESIVEFFSLLCFLTVFMCVAYTVHMIMCVCTYVCKCTHRYESWMSMKSHSLFPETESLPKPGATDWWFWLDSKPQESSCLQSSLPAADITDTHCQASHVRVHWGTDACAARSSSTEQSLPSRELVYFFVWQLRQ